MTYPNPTGPAGSAAMGAADEQALKLRRYEEALDRFAGFEPGEYQLSDEEIMARRAARAAASNQGRPASGMGAAPMPQSVPAIPPTQAILAQLRARPGMLEHLEGIDLDGDGIPDIPMGPPPMDPMGRMEWQAMMQQKQQMAQAAQARKARRKESNNQILLATLQATDPLFGATYTRLTEYIQSLPARVQRPYLEAVERTPGAFLDLYGHLREGILKELRAAKSPYGAMSQPANADPREAIRRAVAGRMSPPVLESAGVMDDRMPGASREAERAALVKRVKAGGAREGDLLRYLELCGV